MRIVVCFKAMAEYDRLSPSDWYWDEDYVVDTHFVRYIFNCYEESALEMALKLADSGDGKMEKLELSALTVDTKKADIFLKHLLAVGYKEAARIEVPKEYDLRFNPSAISEIIARYIHINGQQVALFGMQGAEGENGQTGMLVAERLGWPCIRNVMEIEPDEISGCFRVIRPLGEGNLVQLVEPPIVLIIGQAPSSPRLRHANIQQKLKANKQQINPVTLADLDADDAVLGNNDKLLTGLIKPANSSSALMLPAENTPDDHARYIYQHFFKGQKPA